MAITAAEVKELRERTGAGMMDCKKALTECDGNMDKAIDWLREKGIAKAAKKESRIAAEGLCKVLTSDNVACMVEVNSETDFVAKNEQFLNLLQTANEVILHNQPKTVEEALTLPVANKTLNDLFVEAIATIGEKITLRRFDFLNKENDDCFGVYTHNKGQIVSVCVLKNSHDEKLAKQIAMQIASMAPQYISRDDMPQEVVDHERQIQTEIVKNDPKFEGKPEKVVLGAIEGKVSKSLKEMCLVDQEFFLDPNKKCGQLLKENNTEVTNFVRYLVGEGIEKRQENFADEVAKQMGQ